MDFRQGMGHQRCAGCLERKAEFPGGLTGCVWAEALRCRLVVWMKVLCCWREVWAEAFRCRLGMWIKVLCC